MCECEDFFRFLDDFAQFARLLKRVGHRLVTDDIDASLEEGFGDIKVQIILDNDTDKIDSLISRQSRFGLGHLLIAPIDTGRIDVEILAGLLRLFGVGRKRPSHQCDLTIQVCRIAVHRANKGTPAASDHSVTKFSFHHLNYAKISCKLGKLIA